MEAWMVWSTFGDDQRSRRVLDHASRVEGGARALSRAHFLMPDGSIEVVELRVSRASVVPGSERDSLLTGGPPHTRAEGFVTSRGPDWLRRYLSPEFAVG